LPSEKKQKSRPPKRKRLMRVVFAAAVVAALVYAGTEMYSLTRPELTTKTVLAETVEVPINTEVYVVRDERVIEGVVSGAVVPLARDGERVARGAVIAAVFQNGEDAAKYVRAQALREEIRRYDRLNSQAAFSGLKTGSLSERVRNEFTDFLRHVGSGDMHAAFDSLQSFRDDATTMEIAKGGTLDLVQKKKELSAQIAALEASIGGSMVGTGINSAGFYVGSVDGHENVLDYKNAAKWTSAEITNALSLKRNAPSDSFGKLTVSYNWYMAAVIDAKAAGQLAVGRELTVRFPNSEPDSVRAKVYAKNEDQSGKTAVVLVCSDVSDSTLRLRVEDARIILKEHTGLRVENEAITFDKNGVKGIYVLRGNIVNFRKIDEIYSGDGFVLSKPSTESGFVRLYDKMILDGRGLYDGALIAE